MPACTGADRGIYVLHCSTVYRLQWRLLDSIANIGYYVGIAGGSSRLGCEVGCCNLSLIHSLLGVEARLPGYAVVYRGNSSYGAGRLPTWLESQPLDWPGYTMSESPWIYYCGYIGQHCRITPFLVVHTYIDRTWWSKTHFLGKFSSTVW